MKASVPLADLDALAAKVAGAIFKQRETVAKAHEAAVRKARAIDSGRITKALDGLSTLRADLEQKMEERRELLALAQKTVKNGRALTAHLEAQSGARPAPRRFN